MAGGILYTAELELAPDDVRPFIEWYGGRHSPDLYEAGFDVCTCYQAVTGGMSHIDIYEAASWKVFEGESYLGMGPRDPYGAAIVSRRLDKAHTVYAERARLPAADGKLHADWVAFARFAAKPDVMDALAARIELPTAAKRIRLVERTTDHPRNPTHRPNAMLLAEFADRPPADFDIGAWVLAATGGAVAGLDVFVGHRLYPWPDHKL